MKKNIVILTGAGISAESGIKTFRDADGLWENHKIEDVASIDAFENNPGLVLHFYNERRRQLLNCQPNDAHLAIVELEKYVNVYIITQNVDDLHERAGSKNIIHLHGELRKARSVKNSNLIIDCDQDILIGDKAPDGHQLRPHIVWFGEEVPMIEEAIKLVKKADILIVVGTSLQVYPAASLSRYASFDIPKYLIDPNANNMQNTFSFETIAEKATIGVKNIVNEIIQKYELK
ncbi:MAG: NAD-dependent deacylase [Chitinophagales bacterium]|nr:NAD-dependent deacylase [Chitinophagales bacterium]MCZ2394761.1 NAD-dependent deacylase [Chitinophagales bacterium]